MRRITPHQSQNASMSTTGISTSSPVAQKSVSFFQTVKCIAISNLENMPQEEIEAIWFTAEDLETSKEEMKRAVKALRRAYKRTRRNENQGSAQHQGPATSSVVSPSDSTPDDGECCYRGLEHLVTSIELQKRLEHYNSVVNAVLAMQVDGKDECYIAHASSTLTNVSRERALLMGRLDEEDAYPSHRSQISLCDQRS